MATQNLAFLEVLKGIGYVPQRERPPERVLGQWLEAHGHSADAARHLAYMIPQSMLDKPFLPTPWALEQMAKWQHEQSQPFVLIRTRQHAMSMPVAAVWYAMKDRALSDALIVHMIDEMREFGFGPQDCIIACDLQTYLEGFLNLDGTAVTRASFLATPRTGPQLASYRGMSIVVEDGDQMGYIPPAPPKVHVKIENKQLRCHYCGVPFLTSAVGCCQHCGAPLPSTTPKPLSFLTGTETATDRVYA